ncbi:hypothetical protein ARMSODRAFT_1026670 [Armillaria solidipes]|uniref:Uncharacterized protein n=1 Tax=Armillaria solidipes TaxID=1076256 RepID=A0A2H3AN59_9AGAR|nr:hypothetical protein ARMSODRAFT_1026670 [Armillaria solidipes]
MVIEPEFRSDDLEARISSMVTKNEQRNTRKIVRDTSNLEHMAYNCAKGKGKALKEYSEDDIAQLRQHWYDDYEELLQGVPSKMPPWQAVNHEIPLVEDDKRYHYHLPRCSNALRSEFDEKVSRYTNASDEAGYRHS